MTGAGAFRDIAGHTRDIYERNAERFDAERAKVLFERKWLERFAALMPEGGRVLDVGCGSGEPIARYFIERGLDLTGVDAAAAMLAIARARYPDARWVHADMRALDLGEAFDGVIGWHSFFHLTPDEQPPVLARFAAHLKPGGALMLTVGPEAGEVTGTVGDDTVYHASLSPQEYARILGSLGIDVVAFVPADPECDGATILLARKRPGPGDGG